MISLSHIAKIAEICGLRREICPVQRNYVNLSWFSSVFLVGLSISNTFLTDIAVRDVEHEIWVFEPNNTSPISIQMLHSKSRLLKANELFGSITAFPERYI
jgi:hypothetical protein